MGTFFDGIFCAITPEVSSKQAMQVTTINHEERIIIITPEFGVIAW